MNDLKHMKEQMIPDERTVERLNGILKKKSHGKKALKWTGAVAACLVLSLTVLNFTVPSFAESLPVIGGIFATINNRTDEKYKEPFVNEKSAENAETINAAAKDNKKDPINLTVSEVYCDGLNVSCSFSCDRPDNWDERILCGTFSPEKILVNGEECTDNIMLLPRFEYVNGRYEGSGHFNLYNTFDIDEIPDILNVELVLSEMKPASGLPGDKDLTYEDTENLTLHSKWKFRFSVKCDRENLEYLTPSEEQNGWTLEKIANAPSVGIVKITAPENVRLENACTDHDLFLFVRDADGNTVEPYGIGNVSENPDSSVTYTFEMRGMETMHGATLTLCDKIDGELVTLAEYNVK